MSSSPVFNLIYRSSPKIVALPAAIGFCLLLSQPELAQARQVDVKLSPQESDLETTGTIPGVTPNQNDEQVEVAITARSEPLQTQNEVSEVGSLKQNPATNAFSDSILANSPGQEGSAATSFSAGNPTDWQNNEALLVANSLPSDANSALMNRNVTRDRSAGAELVAQVPVLYSSAYEATNNFEVSAGRESTNPNGVPSSGIPVQWSEPIAQVPIQLDPAVANGAAAGTWVMVWIPYGMPTYPVAPPTGTTTVTPPNFPTQGYYPAWIPPATPSGATGVVGGNIPWSSPGNLAGYGYPYSMPQPNMVPQPIGGGTMPAFPSANFSQPYPSPAQAYTPLMPSSQAYQSYTPYLPSPIPAISQPLPVPNAPNATGTIPALPSPPPVSSPVVPGAAAPSLAPSGFPAAPTTPIYLPTPIPATNQAVTPASTAANSLAAIDDYQEPLTQTDLDLQGLYILEGDDSSARVRLTGSTFLTRYLLVGGALDLVTGPDLTNDDGLQLTELYLATAIPGAPALRFRFGQLDLTSYFDRNSFAKDASRDFFNSTFQTNPALIAGANVTASRIAGLVQWNVTDDIAFSSAIFSSDPDVADFALDGFAAEASFRTGDLIVRGTFISSEDSEFQGTGDRLESYGVNAEWFIPNLSIGLFGRYGKLNNFENDFEADTYSFGINAFNVFMEDDRLGLAYGRNLEIDLETDDEPDVLELFYDFELFPNIRTGFSIQQRNSLSETYAGFRIRSELDLTPSLFAD